jgi:hypothetical protein
MRWAIYRRRRSGLYVPRRFGRRARTVLWGGHPDRDFWLPAPDSARWWARQMLEESDALIARYRLEFAVMSRRSFVGITGLTS